MPRWYPTAVRAMVFLLTFIPASIVVLAEGMGRSSEERSTLVLGVNIAGVVLGGIALLYFYYFSKVHQLRGQTNNTFVSNKPINYTTPLPAIQ
jgi:hypothetical protein